MDIITKLDNNNLMVNYNKSNDVFSDIQSIIETAQNQAYKAVDSILTQRNWLIGYRIAEEELAGHDRADYGTEVIKQLSKELTAKYGKGYDRSNLYHYVRFYKTYPKIIDTACRLSHVRQKCR